MTSASSDGLVDLTSVVDPFGEELAAIREANGGHLPLPDSLDLFASAFGEVPGGDASRFDAAPSHPMMALSAVARHWGELDAAQQQSVQVHLGYSRLQSFRAPEAAPPDAAIQAAVDSARAAIAERVGTDVPFPIIGELVPGLSATLPGDDFETPVAGMALSERGGEWVTTGQPDTCRVKFNSDSGVNDNVVAHEVFHCFQFFLAGDLNVFYDAQSWIVEGSAEWAGAEVGGFDDTTSLNFQLWLAKEYSLYAKAYEAIGYYWVLESMGVAPWTVVGEMLIASGDVAAVAASGLDPVAVLSKVATSTSRAVTVDALPVSGTWDFGISDVPAFGFRFDATVTPTEPYEYQRDHASFSRYEIPVLRLEGGNRVQVSLAADVGALEFFGQDPIPYQSSLVREFCLEEGGCGCGADGTIGELPPGTRDLILTGGEFEGGGTIRFQVRLPDIAFTDGTWQGTMTSTDMSISGSAGSGSRPETTSAIEFIIEGGVVTSGTYALQYPGTFSTPLGAIDGTVSISGAVTGCGYSPELVPATIVIDATMQFPTGDTGPVQVVIDIGAGTVTVQQPIGPAISRPFDSGGDFDTYGSMWVLQTDSTPTRRRGYLDATAELALMGAAGFAVNDVVFFFDISRA
ncbi:MAG: hypothetical protein ABL953_13460 [Ilumatobacteraceae bacterium]